MELENIVANTVYLKAREGLTIHLFMFFFHIIIHSQQVTRFSISDAGKFNSSW